MSGHLLGLRSLGFWGESEQTAEGCDVLIISGLGGENGEPDRVFANRNRVVLHFSFVLSIPSSKKALVDLGTRGAMGHRAAQLPVLTKSTG